MKAVFPLLRTKTRSLAEQRPANRVPGSSSGTGALLAFALLATPAIAEDAFLGTDNAEFSGSIEVEGTIHSENPRFAGQEDFNTSLALRPKLVLEWNDALAGADAVATVTPFLRFDPDDSRRTHADLREAKLELRFDNTDVTFGADYVFWGKTEVDQIVDIINQTDGVEGTDGEDKLGQPMIAVRRLIDIGEVSGQASFFYLPYFRERTFLGRESRLRSGTLIDGFDARYETGAEEWTPSFAARLAGFYGDFDVGVSAFHGLSRDPAFEIIQTRRTGTRGDPDRRREDRGRRRHEGGGATDTDAAGTAATASPIELRPVYGRITQIGLDGQYTSGATLWKLETIGRFDQRNLVFEKEDYVAAIAGFEHTLYGIGDSSIDLGLIGEYAYDSRGDRALTPFENDVVIGARFGFNDTQDTSALVTAAVDTETAETLLRLEAERRIGERVKLSLEAGAYLNTDESSLIHDLQDDHYVRATLAVFW